MKGKKKKGNFIFNSVLALLLLQVCPCCCIRLSATGGMPPGSPRRFLTMRERWMRWMRKNMPGFGEAREYNRALAEQSTRYALTEEQKERYEKTSECFR